MTTRSDLETELIARLQVASNSTLYPSTRITTIIQSAYMWATQLVIWHDLVRARCTSTVATQEYYDYPANFRSESIIRMEVDGEEYKRKNYEDYLAFQQDNPSSTKKIFSSFGRQFFISPIPTTTGSNNITIWGAIQADALSSSSSVPIFSYNKEEANEAVIKKAIAIALVRSDPTVAKSEEQDAITLLMKLSTDESKNTQRNKRLNHPMLTVPDYFNSSGSTDIGSFNYEPDGADE
jgi:hypothetical protein